jgi:hypothetical protein
MLQECLGFAADIIKTLAFYLIGAPLIFLGIICLGGLLVFLICTVFD